MSIQHNHKFNWLANPSPLYTILVGYLAPTETHHISIKSNKPIMNTDSNFSSSSQLTQNDEVFDKIGSWYRSDGTNKLAIHLYPITSDIPTYSYKLGENATDLMVPERSQVRFIGSEQNMDLTSATPSWKPIDKPFSLPLSRNLDKTLMMSQPGLFYLTSTTHPSIKLRLYVLKCQNILYPTQYKILWNRNRDIWTILGSTFPRELYTGDRILFETNDEESHTLTSTNANWKITGNPFDIKLKDSHILIFDDAGKFYLTDRNHTHMKLIIKVNRREGKSKVGSTSSDLSEVREVKEKKGKEKERVNEKERVKEKEKEKVSPKEKERLKVKEDVKDDEIEIKSISQIVDWIENDDEILKEVNPGDTIIFKSNGDKHGIALAKPDWTLDKVLVDPQPNLTRPVNFDVIGTYYFICPLTPNKLRLCVKVTPKGEDILTKIEKELLDGNKLANHDIILESASNSILTTLSQVKSLNDIMLISVGKRDHDSIKLLKKNIGDILISEIMKSSKQPQIDVEYRALSAWYTLDNDYALKSLSDCVVNGCKIDENKLQKKIANRLKERADVRTELNKKINSWKSYYRV